MARPLITVLGSLNVDLVSYVKQHPQPGETMTASSFSTSYGGKGANQAVACAKLSRSSKLQNPVADVAMIGAVGSDAYGEPMKQALADTGIDVSDVRSIAGGKTGVAVIVVDESSGQNRIILSPEANHSLVVEDFHTWQYTTPDLLILQLEIPLDTVSQIITLAQKTGIKVLLNPAPAQVLPDAAYKGLAHLVLNETEAILLSSLPGSSLVTQEGLAEIAKFFIEKGVENVVVTLGERGVYFATKHGVSGMEAALKVQVVDTTAAGDTFIGAYSLNAVQSTAGQFDIQRAVKVANRASAITVTRKGAQVSIPWREELG